MKKADSQFLEKLQEEARFQQHIFKNRVLPTKVDSLTSYIGTHSWQTLTVLSLITAGLLEIVEKL